MLIPMERMTYSCDVKSKALSDRKSEGLTIRETESDADRLSEGHAVAKTDEARPSVPRRRTLEKTALLEDMQQYRDAYPHESAARFNVSQGALWRALRTPGITDQKNAAPQGGRNARLAFQNHMRAYRRANRAVIPECWFAGRLSSGISPS